MSSLDSVSLASTESACSRCGVDMQTVFHQVNQARRKLELMQEKLDVEQEILKQDKRNLRRRIKTAKASTKNIQAEAERRLSEAKFAEEEAKVAHRDLEARLKESEQRAEKLQCSYDEELKALRQRVIGMEGTRIYDSNSNGIHTPTDPSSMSLAERKIKELEEELEDKQASIERYEMQLLDSDRAKNDNNATCPACRRKVRELDEARNEIDLLRDRLKTAEVLLTKEIQSHEATKQRLQNQEQFLVSPLPPPSEAEFKSREMSLLQTISQLTKELDQLKLSNDQISKVESLMLAQADYIDYDSDRRMVTEFKWKGSGNFNGSYTGPLNANEQPHGKGTLRLEDADGEYEAVYDGNFLDGIPNGDGVLATIDGDLYRGNWEDGEKHGHGVFVWSDGRIYRGEFVRGKRQGRGIMTWQFGAHYQGEFENDMRNGGGQYFYADGRCYTGRYQNDRPHGLGTLKDSDGSIRYDGHWEMGEFLGKGPLK